MRKSVLVALSLVLSYPASAQLSDEARLDLLLTRLETSLASQDWSTILSAVSDLRGLGVELPAVVDLYEGEALLETGQSYQALSPLEKYLNTVGSSDARYTEALTLYDRAERHPNTVSYRSQQDKYKNRWSLSVDLFHKLGNNCGYFSGDWNSYSISEIKRNGDSPTLHIYKQGKSAYRPDYGYALSEMWNYTIPLKQLTTTSGSYLSCKSGSQCISYHLRSDEFRAGKYGSTSGVSLEYCNNTTQAARDMKEMIALWHLPKP